MKRVYYEKTRLYEQLVDDHGVFNSYLDFFVFAGSYGFANQTRVEDYEGENEMLWTHIERREKYRVLTAAVAYQETGEEAVLKDEQRQLEILAQYAAGGVQLLNERLEAVAGDPVKHVADLVETRLDEIDLAEQSTN